jgi:alpha-tubulin suppressor-like RCC1 family protein
MRLGRRWTALGFATAAFVSACRLHFDEVPADAEPPCTPVVAIKALDLGNDYGCAQLVDDTLRCFGVNELGQLGDGSYTSAVGDGVTPLGLGPVSAFSVGYQHACAVRAGDVFCWGRNDIGQLGLNNRLHTPAPTRVAGLPPMTHVETGGLSTCAWVTGGALYCWGQNSGTTGQSSNVPRMVSGVPPVQTVAAASSSFMFSQDSVCMLGTDGSTWCWGDGDDYQLGNGATSVAVTPVAAASGLTFQALASGDAHVCGLTAGGEVYCWGRNFDKQAGATDAVVAQPTRVNIGDVVELHANVETTCARLSNGTLKCWGDNDERELGRTGPDTAVPETIDVPLSSLFAVGARQSCAVDMSGVMRCWGTDRIGELSSSATLVRTTIEATQVAAGGDTTCVRTASGAVSCWGSGAFGQLGDRVASGAPSSTPVAVPISRPATNIAVGWTYACAALDDATAQCWGSNNNAQIAFPESAEPFAPSTVPAGTQVRGIATGLVQACALTDTAPWCWGNNSEGALGIANAIDSSPPVMSGFPAASSIETGAYHTCVVTAAGALWCAGRNNEYQVGTGAGTDVYTPANVLNSVTTAACGEDFSCASNGAGTYCWGHNISGQLGLGRNNFATTPSATITGLPAPQSLVAGARHACALSMGTVYCWGNNGSGQLGDGTRTSAGTPVVATELQGALQLAAGIRHTCARFADGTIGCVGGNDAGQLGGQTTVPTASPRQSLLTCPVP